MLLYIFIRVLVLSSLESLFIEYNIFEIFLFMFNVFMKFEFIINCYPQVFVFVCVFYNVVKYYDVVWVFG